MEKIIPIEIKSGASWTLKSIHQFMEWSNPPNAVLMFAKEFNIEETKTQVGKLFY